MCEEVEKHLQLNYVPQKKKGGASLKKQLEHVWEQTGSKPDRLDELEPDIPQAGMDLWDFFWDLKIQETFGWTEIMAYMNFYGLDLQPMDVQTLFAMNATYNSYIQKVESPDKSNSQNNKPINGKLRGK